MNNESIAITWNISDVLEVRPDLTKAEAYKVLLRCLDEHDAEQGITWETIRDAANDMFQEKTDNDMRKYKVKVGRKNVELCYIEIEALSEQHASEKVNELIVGGTFHDKMFTTTAITGERIYDISEVN